MEISILILNYNDKKITAKAVESFLKSDFPKGSFEIIVVDNASSDGSVKFIKERFPKIRIIQNKENSGLGGLNAGLPYCRGKFIFFTNNDVVVEPDCLSVLFKSIKNKKNVALVAPTYINYFSKKIEGHGTWVSRSFYSGYKKKKSGERIIPYIGIGLIRKSILDKIGYLFDEDYFLYAEDVDLGLRIRLLGFNVLYVPEAVLYHMHALTVGKVATPSRIVYLMERNMLTTFFKILEWKNIFFLSPYAFGMRFAAMIKDLSKLRFSNISARLRAILWILLNFKKIMKKRKEIQKNRKINDKELFKLFTEKYLFR